MVLCQGFEDITIRVSDRGMGIPRRNIRTVFEYAYTTASVPVIPGEEQQQNDEHTKASTPMAGFGYGLPLARLYARYFNGELTLSSIEGFGTDAYIFLKTTPGEASEILPCYSFIAAQRAYDNKNNGEDLSWSKPSTHD